MGDATKEYAQSLADELEVIRALSSCGRFGIVGKAHEWARAVWLKVYHVAQAAAGPGRHPLRPSPPRPAPGTRGRGSRRPCLFSGVRHGCQRPYRFRRRGRHRGHAGQTGAVNIEKGQRKETRRGDVAFSSRHDRDRKAGQGFAEVDTADLRDFLDRTVAARVGRDGATCLHLADDGCSLEEMGKQLGISRATAQRRLTEARAVVKACLQAQNLAPPGK